MDHGDAFAVCQVDVQTVGTDYLLRDSVILNSATTIHVINDRSRFIDELRPSKGVIFAGTVVVLVEGIGTAAITVQTPLGPREILLVKAVYVPDFHINLACLTKFNDKDVWWDNRRNLLYKDDKDDLETFAYCERHCN